MKNLRSIILCVSSVLFSLFGIAQNNIVPLNEPDHNRPKLFQDLPEKILVDIPSLSALLNNATGSIVSLNIAKDGNFIFEGQVVSSASKYENAVQSIVIRSSNFNGARLTFTRTLNADKSQAFSGRILSLQHGDLYELKYSEGQYYLIKKKYYELVNE